MMSWRGLVVFSWVRGKGGAKVLQLSVFVFALTFMMCIRPGLKPDLVAGIYITR